MRTAKTGDIFVLLTPPLQLTTADFPWQRAWQRSHGGNCTAPLHVSLQRFVCPTEAVLDQSISALQSATAAMLPLSLVGVDIRPLYSSFRKKHVLKCRVRRDAPLQALDDLVRQTVSGIGQDPHYRHLAVLVTVLEDIAKPPSLAPEPLPTPVPLFIGSRIAVSRIVGQELYEVIAEWELSA